MLILGRKKGEQILIGNDIIVTILRTDGYQIKIGIDAPENVLILRSELVENTFNEEK